MTPKVNVAPVTAASLAPPGASSTSPGEAGDGYVLELLRSGAAGVGYRVGDLETLLSAIHGAHAGDTFLDPSVVNALV